MTTKVCTLCLVGKPVEAFAVRRASSDGRQSRCRACMYGVKNDDKVFAAKVTREQATGDALSGRLGEEAKAAYERIQAKARAVKVTRTVTPGIVVLAPRAPGRLTYRRRDPEMPKAVKL